jgi:hypothetical protein
MFKVGEQVRQKSNHLMVGTVITTARDDDPTSVNVVNFSQSGGSSHHKCSNYWIEYAGLHAERLMGKLAYRIAPTKCGDDSCTKDRGGCTSAPVRILSIDEQGIHVEHNSPNFSWCGKDIFAVKFLDDNWAEWAEEPKIENLKFNPGDKVHIVNSKLLPICDSGGGLNGTVVAEGVGAPITGKCLDTFPVVLVDCGDAGLFPVNPEALVVYNSELDEKYQFYLKAKAYYGKVLGFLAEITSGDPEWGESDCAMGIYNFCESELKKAEQQVAA